MDASFSFGILVPLVDVMKGKTCSYTPGGRYIPRETTGTLSEIPASSVAFQTRNAFDRPLQKANSLVGIYSLYTNAMEENYAMLFSLYTPQ